MVLLRLLRDKCNVSKIPVHQMNPVLLQRRHAGCTEIMFTMHVFFMPQERVTVVKPDQLSKKATYCYR